MFRMKQGLKMDPSRFGVGSVINGGRTNRLLVVAVDDSHTRLLDLMTFTLLHPVVKVEDVNFISEDECRQLISGTGWAFSDFEFETEGLKDFSFKMQ